MCVGNIPLHTFWMYKKCTTMKMMLASKQWVWYNFLSGIFFVHYDKKTVLWFYPTAQTCRSQEKQQNALKSAISKSAFRTHIKSPILTLFWPSKRNTAPEEQKVFCFFERVDFIVLRLVATVAVPYLGPAHNQFYFTKRKLVNIKLPHSRAVKRISSPIFVWHAHCLTFLNWPTMQFLAK